jgi:hypothetical protein
MEACGIGDLFHDRKEEKGKWGPGESTISKPMPPLAFFLHQIPKSEVPKTPKVVLPPVDHRNIITK